MARNTPYTEYPLGVERDEDGNITKLISSRGDYVGARQLEPMTYAAAQALVAAGGVPDYSTVVVTDRNNDLYYVISSALIKKSAGNAQELLLSSATAGDTTGWLPRSANPERFMASLASAGTASILMDGSNDGSISAGNIGTFTLDTASQQVTTPPYCPIYLYIRFTVSSASAPVNVGRGA